MKLGIWVSLSGGYQIQQVVKQFHILNGDALKERFPKDINGERFVARECLVDGSVEGANLTEFFNTRAHFIASNYNGHSELSYFENVVPEFKNMQRIPNDAAINLWFEDDLFCQVNFWFVMHLLRDLQQTNRFFLVRPEVHNQFWFGGLTNSKLISLYENRVELTALDLNKLSSLWEYYQHKDLEKLTAVAQQLDGVYSFISKAVQAHIARIPTTRTLGRPSESIIQIMKDLDTEEFGAVFKEFSKREPIYGFGDLQVKRLFDGILSSR